MRTLIKNGRVVTAVDDYNADILIEDGTISMIGLKIDIQADKVIDAAWHKQVPAGASGGNRSMPLGAGFATR